MRILAVALCGLIALFGAGHAAAQAAATVVKVGEVKVFQPNAEVTKQSLEPFLTYYDDPDGSVPIDAVTGKEFKPLDKPNHGFGFKGIRWVRFTADFTAVPAPEWFLRQNYVHVQNLTLYYPEGSGYRSKNFSEDEPVGHRDFFLPHLIMSMPVAHDGPKTYYLRFEPRGHALNISLDWMRQQVMVEEVHTRTLVAGVFFGAIIILLLYNLLLCLMLRSWLYAYYVEYLVCLTISQIYLSGYASMLVEQMSVRWEQFFAAASFLGIHGITLSGRSILNLKGVMPVAEKWLKGCEWVLLLGTALSFAMPVGMHYPILNVLILSSGGSLLVISLRRSFQGYQPAQIYAVGWITFILVIMSYSLTFLGVLPLNWFTANAVKFAAMLEAMLFSIALAMRFKLTNELAVKAKNSFLAMVSHELKTPLQTIISSLEIAASSPGQLGSERNLKRLVDASMRLEMQVDDLTNFAHLESRKLKLRPSEFNLPELVQEVVESHASAAKKKELSLTAEVLPGISGVYADPLRIRQIVSNLIENSVKYTEQGHIKVRVAKAQRSQTTAFVLEVEDSGVGIDREHIKSIYEPFVQMDQKTYRGSGIGMGLAIVKELVSLMKGSIEVDSAPGKGSVFTVTIPFHLPEGHESAVDELVREGSGKEHLLLVDDHAEVRTTLGEVLLRLRYSVDMCGEGRSALIKARTQDYDAILLDINMPGLDGCEVAQRIRGMDHHKTTPIIWISATKPDWVEKGKGQLFTHFLEKPIRSENLSKLLEAIFQKPGRRDSGKNS